MDTPERFFSMMIGVTLIVAACYLAARPARHTRIIRDYYARRQESETAGGWMGKTVFLPGKRASFAIFSLVVAVALSLGSYAIVVAVTS